MSTTGTGLPPLDNTLGAIFIAIVLAMALWGAGSVQLYYYFNNYRDDLWQYKVLVLAVWALDTVHQGMVTHAAYTYMVTNWGNVVILAEIVPSLAMMVPVSGIICLLVQSFLVMRVWLLSRKNIYLVAVLAALVSAEFIVTIIYSARALQLTFWAQATTVFTLSRAINILGAVSDAAIAFTLIYLLHSSRTGFSRSDTMITRLIMFTINTGLLTTLCAVASLITITTLPNTFIYITFFVAVSRLYTNTILATLNARKSLRMRSADTSEDLSMSLNRLRNRGTEVQTLPKPTGRGVSIKVDTETTKEFYGTHSKILPDNESESALGPYSANSNDI